MLYSVPVTVQQFHDFFEGNMVGFYHSPKAVVKNQCLEGEITTSIEYALEFIYIPHNIAHVLDLVKVTRQIVLIYNNIIEYCGIRVVTLSMRLFCGVNEDRCSFAQIFTNMWWHGPIIGVLSLRIFIACISLIVYAGRRSSDSNAG